MDGIIVKNLQEATLKNISSFKYVNFCRCCNNNLIAILNLNDQPLANSYHELHEELEKFPLTLNLCENCYHMQLNVVVKPSLMFKNYLYVSGTSETLKKYFDFFSKFVFERFLLTNNYSPKTILDIACNDGTQLNFFKSLGLYTCGIDPAENLYKFSSINHEVFCDYFPSDKINKTFDLIIAQNVFAHTDDIESFLKKCKLLLNENGILYIQTSQANMLLNNEFDTIYHEHLSFFNTNSMKIIVEKCELQLNNVFKFDIHGCSYIFEISHFYREGNSKYFIDTEKEKGFLNLTTYKNFAINSLKIVNNLKNTIEIFRNEGYIIIGYGAAAKGMTVLNFGNIVLDIILDDNSLKHNLYTPGTNILIQGVEYLLNYKDDVKILFVPLAWNFYSEIYSKIKIIRNNSNDKFLLYFPDLEIRN